MLNSKLTLDVPACIILGMIESTLAKPATGNRPVLVYDLVE